jgi:hypothetical protein
VPTPIDNAPTSVNTDIRVVAAIALARILDNAKAISSQPPAAGQLIHIMNQLRKSAASAKPKLAAVREMTKKGGA